MKTTFYLAAIQLLASSVCGLPLQDSQIPGYLDAPAGNPPI